MNSVRQLTIAALVLLTAAAPASAQAKKAAAPAVAGTGTIYVGNYKGTISVIDEASEKIVGEIPLKAGIPGRIVFSNDWSRLYIEDIGYEHIEIVDREKRASLDVMTLSEGKTKVRIWGMQPDPSDKYLILVIKRYTLDTDHWEIGPPHLCSTTWPRRRSRARFPGRRTRSAKAQTSSSRRTAS